MRRGVSLSLLLSLASLASWACHCTVSMMTSAPSISAASAVDVMRANSFWNGAGKWGVFNFMCGLAGIAERLCATPGVDGEPPGSWYPSTSHG
jgi:hypothetical protein